MTKLDERNRLLEKRLSGSNRSPHIRSHPGTRAEYATTTGTVLLQREIGPPLLLVSVTTTMAHIGPIKECPFHPHLPCVVIPRKKPNGGSRTERGPRDDIEKTRCPLSALWMAYTVPPVEGQEVSPKFIITRTRQNNKLVNITDDHLTTRDHNGPKSETIVR